MTSDKIYAALTGAVLMVVATVPAVSADLQTVRIRQAAPDQVLPAYEVVTILRSHGLDPLRAPLRYGVTYRVRAIDRAGRDVNVVIDARYGDVLLVEAAMEGPYPERRIAAVPSAYDDPEFFDGPPRTYSNAPPAYVRPNLPRVIKPTPRVATVPANKPAQVPRPRPEPVAAQIAPAATRSATLPAAAVQAPPEAPTKKDESPQPRPNTVAAQPATSSAPATTVPEAAPPAPKAETVPADDAPTKWKDEPTPTTAPTSATPKAPDVTPLE